MFVAPFLFGLSIYQAATHQDIRDEQVRRQEMIEARIESRESLRDDLHRELQEAYKAYYDYLAGEEPAKGRFQ